MSNKTLKVEHNPFQRLAKPAKPSPFPQKGMEPPEQALIAAE